MFYCRQRGFPAANQHPVTMGCIARLVVALLCATSAYSALASPAWSALYGNAQYTAFVASDTTLPPAQWNVTWDASSAWLPAHGTSSPLLRPPVRLPANMHCMAGNG